MEHKKTDGGDKDPPADTKPIQPIEPIEPTELIDKANEDYKESVLPEAPAERVNPYWLIAKRDKEKHPYNYESVTKETGKFLIFRPREELMELWTNKIKPGTEEGRLGIGAKVSTEQPKPSSIGGGHEKEDGVICVYTYTDKEDRDRVAGVLKEMGVAEPGKPLKYKSDEDTMLGVYSGSGNCSQLHDFSVSMKKADGHWYTVYGGAWVKTKGEDFVSIAQLDGKEDEIEEWMHEDELAKYGEGGSRKRLSEAELEAPVRFSVYKTEGQYAQEGKKYIHIQEIEFKTKDVLFPSDQSQEIIGAIDKLIQHVHNKEEEGGETRVVQGATTSHIKVYGKYSAKHKEFCLFIAATKKKVDLCIPQSQANALFNDLNLVHESL